MSDPELVAAARNAADVICSIYEWLDRVEEAGGVKSMSGVAACHAMLTSLRKNADRTEKLVLEPLRTALATDAAGARGGREMSATTTPRTQANELDFDMFRTVGRMLAFADHLPLEKREPFRTAAIELGVARSLLNTILDHREKTE